MEDAARTCHALAGMGAAVGFKNLGRIGLECEYEIGAASEPSELSRLADMEAAWPTFWAIWKRQ